MSKSDAPAWLIAAVDQRLSLIETALGADLANQQIVMTPLTEPSFDTAAAAERWERTCDNCGRYCEPEDTFVTGNASRVRNGTQVVITFGACPTCIEAR